MKGRLAHGAVTRIARKCRVSVSLVSAVLHGKRRNAAVERAIAKSIGEPVEVVFPSREESAA